MFEDIITKKEAEVEPRLHMCAISIVCDQEFCLHKHPHYQNELGRPEQPEDESPCDCSKIQCGKNYVVCIPI